MLITHQDNLQYLNIRVITINKMNKIDYHRYDTMDSALNLWFKAGYFLGMLKKLKISGYSQIIGSTD